MAVNRDAILDEAPTRGFWCRASRIPKFAYLTIDDAWAHAWRLNAYDGRIVTPYACHRIRTYYAEVRLIVQPNPWRWSPVTILKMRMRAATRAPHGYTALCGCWHLTRSTAHLLPRCA